MKKQKKLALCALLALLLLAGPFSLCFTAYAEDPHGSCGEGVVWTLRDGVLTVSGEGPMDDYETGKSPFYGLDFIAAVIKKGVTKIGANAFDGCAGMKSLTAPTDCEGSETDFEGCVNLRSVFFTESDPDNIGPSIFRYDAAGLENVTWIKQGVTPPWAGGPAKTIEAGKVYREQLAVNTPMFIQFTPKEDGVYTLYRTAPLDDGWTMYLNDLNNSVTLLDEYGAVLQWNQNHMQNDSGSFALKKDTPYYFSFGVPLSRFRAFTEDVRAAYAAPLDYCLLKEDAPHEHVVGDEETVYSEGSCTTLDIRYKTCAICGMRVFEHAEAVHGQMIYSEVTPSTCALGGRGLETCPLCGYTRNTYYPPLSHVDEDYDQLCDLCGEKAEARTVTEGASFRLSHLPQVLSSYVLFTPEKTAAYDFFVNNRTGGCVFSVYDFEAKSAVEPLNPEVNEGSQSFSLTAGKTYALTVKANDAEDLIDRSFRIEHFHTYSQEPKEVRDAPGTCSIPQVSVYQCECGEVLEKNRFANHFDTDLNGKCDACGFAMIVAKADEPLTLYENQTPRTKNEESNIIVFCPEKDGVYVLRYTGEYFYATNYNSYRNDQEYGSSATSDLTPGIYKAGEIRYFLPLSYDGIECVITSQIVPWSGGACEDIAPGDGPTVEVESKGYQFYRFIPAEDGLYRFIAANEEDRPLYIELFDEDGKTLKKNSISWESTAEENKAGNRLDYSMTAGKTYYYAIHNPMPFGVAFTFRAGLERTGDALPNEGPVTPKENAEVKLNANGQLLGKAATVADFLGQLDNAENVTVTSADGKTLGPEDRIGTGAVISTADGQSVTVAIKGDTDGDGEVKPSDARDTLRASVGLENYAADAPQFAAADADGNGEVKPDDARTILRASVGLDDFA